MSFEADVSVHCFRTHFLLTLIMAAPSASVEEPPTVERIRHARSVSKLVETAAPTTAQKNMSEASTKTGLLPRYSAAGTQKKFWLRQHFRWHGPWLETSYPESGSEQWPCHQSSRLLQVGIEL